MKKKKDKRSGDVGRAHDASGDRTTRSLAACYSTCVSSRVYCGYDAPRARFQLKIFVWQFFSPLFTTIMYAGEPWREEKIK